MLDKKYNEVFKNTNVITRHVAFDSNKATLLDTSANDIAFTSEHKAFSTAQYKHCYLVRQYYTDMILNDDDDDCEVTLDLITLTFVYSDEEVTYEMLTESDLEQILFAIDFDRHCQIDFRAFDERETMLIELY